MKLYQKYIFDKTLKIFFAILFLLVSLIWFSKTISFVKYITENGIELSQFLFLFLLILPWLLMFIVPISLFAAVLMVFNKMIADNEIAILKNTGLTNIRILRPAFMIAVFATLFCFLVSFVLMPYANKKLRLARINFENNYSNIAFSAGVFEGLKSLTIYIREKDENQRLYGVLLHDERNPQYSLTVTSKTGNLSFEEGSLLLYMQDGTAQRFNRAVHKTEILKFDNYVFNLSDNEDGKEKKTRWKPKERYLNELMSPNDDSVASDLAKYRAEIQQRITYPLMPIVVVLIASGIMLSGDFSRRGNNYNVIYAIIMAVLFLGSTITIYRLIETKFHLMPLLYLNYVLFIGFSLRKLWSRNRLK